MRSLSGLVSEGFIQGVGITRPKPEKERQAAFYITGLLVTTVVGIAAVFLFLVTRF